MGPKIYVGPWPCLRRSVVRGLINSKVDVRLRTSQAGYDYEGRLRSITLTKRRNFVDKEMHCEHIRQNES